MKFGSVAIKDSVGGILAHSMLGIGGYISKGTVLDATHIAQLCAAGHENLVVARLEKGDVEENLAATRLAKAIVCKPEMQGLRVARAGAGRVNLYSTRAGIVLLDEAAILAVNTVNPMITIATVSRFKRVEEGSMIATIKIISYSVSEVALEDACSVGLSGLGIAAPIFETATLVETQVEENRGTGKGQVAITGRLDRLGVQLESKIVVEHKKDQLADALKEAKGDVVFILTASATSDPLDVGPEALRKAGGVITAYGMPVDPGNLLFLGWLGKKPVIGLPGCARSPALNGADWVLERIICGQRLTQAHISSMGVGGLLKEIPTRPMPRAL